MRSRRNERELKEMLAEVTAMVPEGSIWQHFKGTKYRIVCVAFDEDTLEFVVIYHPMKYPDVRFARSLTGWQETRDWHGYSLPRFEHIEK